MKHFNWGHGIVAAFVVFAIGTFIMVYIAMTTKVDMVTDDYYEKELKYQQQIDMETRSKDEGKKLQIGFASDAIIVQYPAIGDRSQYRGTIHLFRPSDRSRDMIVNIEIDSTYIQRIPASAMIKGFWRMKITWSVGADEYYHEQPVMLQ
jgi:hypothetical protein